ncbi:MAG: type I-E CRISPR-associated protein Cas5/CasD, partial [Luteolibacter sp.]
MSDTLAFLIDAPLQSWGASSKFQRRETEGWPTKSALIGVLAAALGIDKHAPDESEKLAPIAALSFSVFRWSKTVPVTRLADFHTIGGGYDKTNPSEKLHIPCKAGDGSPFGTVITRRSYLMDARFIVIFQGERATLEAAAAALLDPVWGVWFGRKTCIPAEPLCPVVAAVPREALVALLQKFGNDPAEVEKLEGMTESPGPGRFYQADQPVAYGQHHGPVPQAYHSRPVRRLAPG